MLPVTFADIEAAAERIAAYVVRTPTLAAPSLDERADANVFLKLETRQRTGSFKDRGAANRLLQLTADERARGVIAMSAGNHAQAVAYQSARLGIAATIVMPDNTPFTKIRRTQGFGARVVLAGDGLADAGERAHAIAAAEGLTVIHPYDDARIVAGQGTAGLEFLTDVPDLDVLVVPVGGGGLIAGVARLIGECGANILDVMHQRLFSDVTSKNAELDITVETATPQDVERIFARLHEANYRPHLLMTTGSVAGREIPPPL
ncbi:MAG: hypothetical protein NVS4B5_05940 [Vulcanimicrobiaceae bacterium]